MKEYSRALDAGDQSKAAKIRSGAYIPKIDTTNEDETLQVQLSQRDIKRLNNIQKRISARKADAENWDVNSKKKRKQRKSRPMPLAATSKEKRNSPPKIIKPKCCANGNCGCHVIEEYTRALDEGNKELQFKIVKGMHFDSEWKNKNSSNKDDTNIKVKNLASSYMPQRDIRVYPPVRKSLRGSSVPRANVVVITSLSSETEKEVSNKRVTPYSVKDNIESPIEVCDSIDSVSDKEIDKQEVLSIVSKSEADITKVDFKSEVFKFDDDFSTANTNDILSNMAASNAQENLNSQEAGALSPETKQNNLNDRVDSLLNDDPTKDKPDNSAILDNFVEDSEPHGFDDDFNTAQTNDMFSNMAVSNSQDNNIMNTQETGALCTETKQNNLNDRVDSLLNDDPMKDKPDQVATELKTETNHETSCDIEYVPEPKAYQISAPLKTNEANLDMKSDIEHVPETKLDKISTTLKTNEANLEMKSSIEHVPEPQPDQNDTALQTTTNLETSSDNGHVLTLELAKSFEDANTSVLNTSFHHTVPHYYEHNENTINQLMHQNKSKKKKKKLNKVKTKKLKFSKVSGGSSTRVKVKRYNSLMEEDSDCSFTDDPVF